MIRNWKAIIAIQIVIFVLLSVLLFPSGLSDPSSIRVVDSMEKDENLPLLRVADDYNYPPYSYLDENGNPSGYNIELIRALADVMGYQLDLQLIPWPDVMEGLETGEIDLTSGMFYSAERANTYVFSTKHSLSYGDIFTVWGNEISSLEELRGKSVAVLRDDVMEDYLREQSLDLNLVQVGTVREALSLVSQQLVDYAGVVKPVGMYEIDKQSYTNLRGNGLLLLAQDYCVAANMEQSHLIDEVNSGLQILKANGKYNEIYDRWLGVYEPWSMKAFFQKYFILFILFGALLMFLTEGIFVLRYLVKKKSDELEISYTSQLAAEMKNKAILEAIPDMIFYLNTEGVILEYSRKHMGLKGLVKDGRLTEKIEMMLGQRQIDRMTKIIKMVAKTGQMETDRMEILQDGEYYHLEFRMIKLNADEVMAIVRDITQQYLDEMKIRYLSEHDQLTDLMNRRFFESEIRGLNESDLCPVSIIMIDVNGLKLINDSFGHHRGDELLIKVANILRETCENKGRVSRTGGDEFVVMLPLYNYEKTRDIVNQIHQECSRYQVAGLEISVSIGWATKVSPGEDLQEVLIKAEDFMYKEKLLEAPGMHGEAINAIMHTLYEKNQREEEHSQRVSKLSYALAKALSLSDEDCNELKTVALLHDIGKIAIPETILNKPGRLTHDEFQEIKKHPEIGFRILSSINSMAAMGEYVLSHHERWDGKGYPRGLRKEEIPFLARIITIADAYDAMTSERNYKMKMTKWQAAEEIEGNLGTQFDPFLGRIFIERVLFVTLEELDA